MSSAVLLAAATAVLALHYRWALLDPHAPQLRPGWSAAAATAAWVALLFVAALGLLASERPRLAAFVSSFAFGTAISPTIAPPYRLTPAEEPSALRRFARSRLHGVRVVSIKMLLIVPVSLVLEPLVARHPSFFASALVALFFSGVKAAYLLELLRGPALTAADLVARRVLSVGGVARLASMGAAALVLWLALVYPLVDRFPEPELDDYAMLSAFVFGLLLRPG
ncbi:MAG: hypothetical protein ACLFU0_07425 [Alphaproteobacteria bacterium]